jgi:hypothetical protein
MTTQAGVVYVTLKVDPPSATIVDERQPLAGRPVVNRYDLAADGGIRIGIRRGRHKLSAKLDGYTDGVWEFDAEPGAEQARDFKLEKMSEAPATVPGTTPSTSPTSTEMHRPIPVPVFIGAAATGGLLIGSGVVGIIGMGKKSDFNKVNDGQHLSQANDLRSSGQTLNIVGDVLLAGGVVAGVVTTILYLNRPSVAVDGSPAHDTGALRFEPVVASTGGGMWVTGGF